MVKRKRTKTNLGVRHKCSGNESAVDLCL